MEPKEPTQAREVRRNLKAPVVGAVAGILFAVLFTTSMVLMDATVADIAADRGAWLLEGSGRFSFAVGLVPFAGIFLLWFIAVLRDRLGDAEDKFFATVFLGSGLLFLAMMFCAAAVGGAIAAGYARSGRAFAGSGTFLMYRDLMNQIFTVYALRMGAVFVLSQATLGLFTGVLPRWMAYLGYAAGLIMLVAFDVSGLTILMLPAWVLLVSCYILVANRRGPEAGTT